MARRWFKVKRDWYTSPSHTSISGDALHLGPFLFYLADPNWDKDGDDSAPIADAGFGTPLSAEAIATQARWPAKRVRAALAELVAVGTLTIEGDLYSVPNFGRHQQDPSARRKRTGKPAGDSCGKSSGDSEEIPEEKDEKVPSSSSSLSLPKIQEGVVRQLEENMGIPISPSAYVVDDACKRVANRDYQLEDVGRIVVAVQAGKVPGVQPLRAFQKQHIQAVRRHVFGDGLTIDC